MEEKKRGRPRGSYNARNLILDSSGKTLVQFVLSNNYLEFLRDITVNNPSNSLMPADFMVDILSLFHHMLSKDPEKLKDFLGLALYWKYFEHLVDKKDKK